MMRVALIAIALIATCVRGGRGHKKVHAVEQEVVNLRENLTILWELVGNLQMQLERLELENNRTTQHHHHHHHYHHRYFAAVNNDTIEDTNETLDFPVLKEHEVTFERDLLPTDGEHHHHHHHIHHHHPKKIEINNETDSEGKCGNSNFNGSQLEDDDSEETLAKAICHVRPNRALPPNERQNVRGTVHFRQKLNHLNVVINLRGFVTTPEHAPLDTSDQLLTNQNGQVLGLQVHEFGDLSNGCESAGGHYQLHEISELGEAKSKNIGDFGNLECDNHGKLGIKLSHPTASLAGTHSIIGKTLVIHENAKSESSLTNGNSGRRLACCIITKEDD